MKTLKTIIIFLMLLVNSSPAIAAYTISQLTNSSSQESWTRINANGDVVWMAAESSNWGVYLFKASTSAITRLSTGVFPAINNSGMVVWANSPFGVYLFDGTTTKRISANNYLDIDPQINSSGQVVWSGRKKQSDDFEIFFYDGNTTTQLTANSVEDLSPQINNAGQIAWFSLNQETGERDAYFADPN